MVNSAKLLIFQSQFGKEKQRCKTVSVYFSVDIGSRKMRTVLASLTAVRAASASSEPMERTLPKQDENASSRR